MEAEKTNASIEFACVEKCLSGASVEGLKSEIETRSNRSKKEAT